MAKEYSLRVAFKVLRIPTKFLLPNVRHFEVLNQGCLSKNIQNQMEIVADFNGIETSGIGTERFPKKNKKLGLSQFGPDTFSRVVSRCELNLFNVQNISTRCLQ